LSDLILKKSCKSVVFDNREFFPDGSIESLITRESVMEELVMTKETLRDGPTAELLDFILTRGKRLFAILINIGLTNEKLVGAIRQFLEISFGDASLPITNDNVHAIPFFGKKIDRQLRWDSRLKREFRFKQFEYLAPVFSSDNLDMELDAQYIFPFIARHGDRKTGGFGEVYQVDVHPSHHKTPILTFNNERSSIAVKHITAINSTDEAKLRTLKAEWKKEVNAHIDISKCNEDGPHPNIIEFIAAVTKGDNRYLLFRWADGGNLQEFWQSNAKPQLTVALVRDVIKQLRGLAHALEKLHGYGGGDSSYRHGDMKPENILRVRTRPIAEGQGSSIDVGILKIADMGLAKHHTVLTELRPPTSMKYSTYRYEPPEIVLEKSTKSGGRSRRQDIWSIGCVTLEFIIWLLYGFPSLNDFNKKYVVDAMDQLCPYFEIEGKVGENKRAKLHPAVEETMDLLSKDQECKVGVDSAIKDLLSIVRTKLLVVNLNVESVARATAKELRLALQDIVDKGEGNESYWYTGLSRSDNLRLPRLRSSGSNYLSPASAMGIGAPLAPRVTITPPEDFTLVVPLFDPRFTIKDSWTNLEQNLDTCDFCKLRWEASKHLRSENIGFPKLPSVGSDTHFDIVRQFIRDCDLKHPKCVPSQIDKSSSLPTRLLDLGSPESPVIRIYKTGGTDVLQYVALSHRWGPGPEYFCTDQKNIKEYEERISFEKLPKTFQDAVTTTRKLGLRYLWIDSLCIIQGDDGDFAQEALRMEDVFSSAYCILAASSAKGPNDGFLVPRKDNDFITFDIRGQNVYVCRFMDDFENHVLRGPLSKRGWVMQERALAHRTIFFTDRQTYFECGEGVRCETLTKMENQLVSFLGDANFPSKIATENVDRGERIRLYEYFYRQYSLLDFTRWSDRPIAIAGLQKRLLRDLEVKGGFGVFDDDRSFLQRSLLWRKDPDVSVLQRIDFSSGKSQTVPSWSWMGYKNAIDYLEMPFGGMDWTTDDIISPWAEKKVSTTVHGTRPMQLEAIARAFAVGEDHETQFGIFYDMANPSPAVEKTLKCVILGKVRARRPKEETTHYVLIIAPLPSPKGERIYERAGVGYMAGRYIE
ncbi:HET-domain-containing protein, partial [Cadophora sp. DSE1049]